MKPLNRTNLTIFGQNKWRSEDLGTGKRLKRRFGIYHLQERNLEHAGAASVLEEEESRNFPALAISAGYSDTGFRPVASRRTCIARSWQTNRHPLAFSGMTGVKV